MDEIALIRDTINHYGPVFIAPLSIQFVAQAFRKNSAVGLVRPTLSVLRIVGDE